MSNRGNSILRSAREALAYAQGDKTKGRATIVSVAEFVDVRKIRAKLNLSQTKFAERFGFSVSTVRDWEQKRRMPEGPARTLLTVIDRDPKAIERALSGKSSMTRPVEGG